MTLAEYLAYDDGTENRYELVNGRVVAILTLTSGSYTEQIFQAQTPLLSPIFPNLNLTADSILNAGL